MDWDLTKDLNVSKTPCDLYLSKEQVEKYLYIRSQDMFLKADPGGSRRPERPVLGTLGVGM